MSFIRFAPFSGVLKSFFGNLRPKVTQTPSSHANTASTIMPRTGYIVPSVADSGRISFGAAARPARR